MTLVDDDLDDETHQRMDKQVVDDVTTLFSSDPPSFFVLNRIVEGSEGKLNAKYQKLGDAGALIKEHAPDLEEKLRVAWDKRSFRDIRRLSILRVAPVQSPPPPQYHRTMGNQQKAVEVSWERKFIGEAANALWEHIVEHYNPGAHHNIYAHYIAIVQSSGMGKSRTVDELSKRVFTIPLNLREATSTGYPPADHQVRNFLTQTGTQRQAYDRVCAFLTALFECAAVVVDTEGAENIASKFRQQMTQGQTFMSANKFRIKFYDEVVRKAKRLYDEAQQRLGTGATPVYTTPSKKDKDYDFRLSRACKQLISALRGRSERKDTPMGFAHGDDHDDDDDAGVPRIIIAADEAHTITNIALAESSPESSAEWSPFTELRHALRPLQKFPIFSIFMSTVGKIAQFTSPKDDPSRRLVQALLHLIPPFTDVGFDTLAIPVSIDKGWTLETLTSNRHVSHLGRPMFGAIYDAGDKACRKDIILLAKAKLLNANEVDAARMSADQKLACLSARLPIQFYSTAYTAQADQMKQVEGHMRVCLKADAGLETMITISPSEPILSEAAYIIMSHPSFNAPEAMKNVFDRFSVHKGDRGELVAMLMLTIARDKVVGDPNKHGLPKSRIMDVVAFLNDGVFRGLGDNEAKLKNDFPTSKIYFNHYIKVHEHACIDAESLLYLCSRGAAVLCPNSLSAIGGVNPFLYRGTDFRRENLGLILWQAKNNAAYTDQPDAELFTVMDPYKLNILKEGEDPVPLIKIVFALASKTPSLKVVRIQPSDKYKAVIYEIWCAGISHEHLAVVEMQDETTWGALLQASYGWKEMYKAKGSAQQLRTMNPGAACHAGHWQRWTG